MTKPGPKPKFTDAFRVRVEPEVRAELEQIAEANEVTLAHVVRWAVSAYLDDVRGRKENPRKPTLDM